MSIPKKLSDKPLKSFIPKIFIILLTTIICTTFHCLDIPCISKTIFNISCPGCGYTRSLLSVLRLDFVSAWNYHPLFWLFPILVILFFKDGVIFSKKIYNTILLSAIGFLFLITWIVRLINHTLPD
ncbi:DUF2752 domain-containing protein [bacterium]|nr:DUF2752 domain-containing protein [bacterium]